jgi:hypothetical protein
VTKRRTTNIAASVRQRLSNQAKTGGRPFGELLQYFFDGPVLVDAIRRTFARRGTEISAQPVALTERFASDASKIAQWRAFLRKSRIEDAPDDLAPVIPACTP